MPPQLRVHQLPGAPDDSECPVLEAWFGQWPGTFRRGRSHRPLAPSWCPRCAPAVKHGANLGPSRALPELPGKWTQDEVQYWGSIVSGFFNQAVLILLLTGQYDTTVHKHKQSSRWYNNWYANNGNITMVTEMDGYHCDVAIVMCSSSLTSCLRFQCTSWLRRPHRECSTASLRLPSRLKHRSSHISHSRRCVCRVAADLLCC